MPRHQSSSSSSSDPESSSSEEINFTTIVVSNLTSTINEDHLKEIFSNFGQIQSLGIRQTQSKSAPSQVYRHAMINFSQQKDAQTAVEFMDDGWIDGLKIRVKLDNDKKQESEQKPKQEDNKNISNLKRDTQRSKQDKNNEGKNPKYEESLSQIQPKRKQRLAKKISHRSSRKQDRPRQGGRNRHERSRSYERRDRRNEHTSNRRRNRSESVSSSSSSSGKSSRSRSSSSSSRSSS